MKKKYINKRITKLSYTLEVLIWCDGDGKPKRFGSFKRSDFDSDKAVMKAERECRDKALNDIRQNKVINHDLTVEEVYQKSKELFVTNIKTRERHDAIFRQLIPETLRRKPMLKVSVAKI